MRAHCHLNRSAQSTALQIQESFPPLPTIQDDPAGAYTEIQFKRERGTLFEGVHGPRRGTCKAASRVSLRRLCFSPTSLSGTGHPRKQIQGKSQRCPATKNPTNTIHPQARNERVSQRMILRLPHELVNDMHTESPAVIWVLIVPRGFKEHRKQIISV